MLELLQINVHEEEVSILSIWKLLKKVVFFHLNLISITLWLLGNERTGQLVTYSPPVLYDYIND